MALRSSLYTPLSVHGLSNSRTLVYIQLSRRGCSVRLLGRLGRFPLAICWIPQRFRRLELLSGLLAFYVYFYFCSSQVLLTSFGSRGLLNHGLKLSLCWRALFCFGSGCLSSLAFAPNREALFRTTCITFNNKNICPRLFPASALVLNRSSGGATRYQNSVATLAD